MTVTNTVADGKLSDEQLGNLHRRVDEVKRRLNEGTIKFLWAINELQRIVEGRKVVESDYIIDFDATPSIPAGLSINAEDQIVSRFRGKWTFNQKGLVAYLSKKQKKGGLIVGNDLKDELDGESVMGAQLLDFYLKHPHLIPDEYKGKATFFWGTIYRDLIRVLCVRHLYQDGEGWASDYFWLGDYFGFGQAHPALLANQS